MPKQPVLVMIQGPDPGSVYKLPDNRITTIGRSSRNTIRAVSPSVSRFHCEVACVNGRWLLNDLNSKRGTLVNGDRITDRWPLSPGDVVRTATTVFRFDMIDETAVHDQAFVAIMEAGLDQKLQDRRVAAAGSLEEIRERSRLEGRHVREERRRRRSSLRANLVLVGAVAAGVALIVAGVLALAHRRVATPGERAAREERKARQAQEEALAALKDGETARGLYMLAAVAENYPDTEAAAEAGQRRDEVEWGMAEAVLAAVAQAEAQSDYDGALARYEELERMAPSPRLAEVIRQRREYTERLAAAAGAPTANREGG